MREVLASQSFVANGHVSLSYRSSNALFSFAGTAIHNFGLRSIEVPRRLQGAERMHDRLVKRTPLSSLRINMPKLHLQTRATAHEDDNQTIPLMSQTA